MIKTTRDYLNKMPSLKTTDPIKVRTVSQLDHIIFHMEETEVDMEAKLNHPNSFNHQLETMEQSFHEFQAAMERRFQEFKTGFARRTS